MIEIINKSFMLVFYISYAYFLWFQAKYGLGIFFPTYHNIMQTHF